MSASMFNQADPFMVAYRPRYVHLASYNALLAFCAELDAAYVASDDRGMLDAVADHIGIEAQNGFKASHLHLLMVVRETHDGLNCIPNYSLSNDPLHQATWDAEVYLDDAAEDMLVELRDALAEARKIAMQVAA